MKRLSKIEFTKEILKELGFKKEEKTDTKAETWTKDFATVKFHDGGIVFQITSEQDCTISAYAEFSNVETY